MRLMDEQRKPGNRTGLLSTVGKESPHDGKQTGMNILAQNPT